MRKTKTWALSPARPMPAYRLFVDTSFWEGFPVPFKSGRENAKTVWTCPRSESGKEDPGAARTRPHFKSGKDDFSKTALRPARPLTARARPLPSTTPGRPRRFGAALGVPLVFNFKFNSSNTGEKFQTGREKRQGNFSGIPSERGTNVARKQQMPLPIDDGILACFNLKAAVE